MEIDRTKMGCIIDTGLPNYFSLLDKNTIKNTKLLPVNGERDDDSTRKSIFSEKISQSRRLI